MKRFITCVFVFACASAWAATIANQLTTLDGIKNDIKAAIEGKGQTVTDAFSSYAPAIASITTGGGGRNTSDTIILFKWGSRDWTIASTASSVAYYEDIPGLASAITDVSGTAVASYNAELIPYFRSLNMAGISNTFDRMATFTRATPSSVGTFTAQTVSAVETYRFGVLNLPTGMLLGIPRVYWALSLYDPVTHKSAAAPYGGWVDYGFWGGTTTKRGITLLSPFNSDYIGLYNSRTNTYVNGPLAETEDRCFSGALNLQNGLVYLNPYLCDYVGLYNADTNTYTRGAYLGGDCWESFQSSVLMSNGKVFMAPNNSGGKCGLYDPIANTYTDGPVMDSTSATYWGCCNLSNGLVCAAPNNAKYIGLYNPVTNTYTRGPYAAEAVFSDAIQLTNGLICLVPYNHGYIGLYDPVKNTYLDGPAVTSNTFAGGKLTRLGEVFMVPWGYAQPVGWYNNGFKPVPMDALLHPLINHY